MKKRKKLEDCFEYLLVTEAMAKILGGEDPPPGGTDNDDGSCQGTGTGQGGG